ncbi:MAG: 5'-methylthioadenosine/S-adenosylhomocysteine nucleosidase [Oscillospiraceae bacterium]
MSGLTGILCAVEQEIHPFLDSIQTTSTTEKGALEFIHGFLDESEVVLVRSGMGKVNAACAAQSMIDHFPIDRLIISGVGGSLDKNLRLFDLIVCDRCTHHDLPMDIITGDYPRMDTPWFYSDRSLFSAVIAANEHIRPGIMVTGEKFIDCEGRAELTSRFSAEGLLAADMETAAVAQACFANSVPFCAVRAISDTEEACGLDVFWQNVAKASVLAHNAVVTLLKKINL